MIQNVKNVVEILGELNLYSVFFRLLLATVLSGFIGIERSKHGRAAGLRTHILVCLGATIISMTGIYLYKNNFTTDATRMAAQVVSGIGFLGAGTILVKNKSIVTGLTTAACVWATGAMGIAIGFGFYEAAIIGSLFIFAIVGKLGNADRKLHKISDEFNVYIELKDAKKTNDFLSSLKEKNILIMNTNITPPKTNNKEGIGIELFLITENKQNLSSFIKEVNDNDNVFFAILN